MRLALLFLAPLVAAAQTGFTARGFDHFYNLEYDQAIGEFEQAARAAPQDPSPHNNIAQALLYREMFRNGALESELISGNNSFLRSPKLNPSLELEKRFESEVQRAMDLSQIMLKKNPNDVRALYALAVANGLRSNYDFLVRKAWRDALSEATAARKLCNRVVELDPSNYDARLIQGVHDYVVGSLPWYLKSLGFLAGFHGDRELGLLTLEQVAVKGKLNNVDAQILLCALYRRERQPRKALPIVTGLLRRYPRDYLFRLEQAQMYSDLGDKRNALEAMDAIAGMKKSGAPGFDTVTWEKVYYQIGNIQFWYNDLTPALENLRKATASPKDLDLNTGVLAYMRMGQIYDLTGRHKLAIGQYSKAIEFAPQAEAAKESRRYILSPYKREKS